VAALVSAPLLMPLWEVGSLAAVAALLVWLALAVFEASEGG